MTGGLSVRRVSYPSADGTAIGLFLIHREDVTPQADTPAILSGYGGFTITVSPGWQPRIAAWNLARLADTLLPLVSDDFDEAVAKATEAIESKRIEAEGAAKNIKLNADAQAERIRLLEESRGNAERDRMDIYKTVPPAALFGLAARELAGKLQSIEHLTLSPDLLGSLLQRVLGAQANRLEHDAE